MQICWVFASTYQHDFIVNVDTIRSVGPSWGSWRTWRGNQTDNVVCSDPDKAKELASKAFQAVCNFYVNSQTYKDLGNPTGIKAYDGEYNRPVSALDDVVSLHLASQTNNIVLMLGFDLSPPFKPTDPEQVEQLQNYHGLIRSLIQNNPKTQYVLVDHATEIGAHYKDLSNLTCDTMKNVLQLLV